jgi:hypothetical protein
LLSFAAGVTGKPTQVLPPLPELCLSKKPLSDIIGMCHAELLHSDFFFVGGEVSLFCRFFGTASQKLCFKSASKMCVFNNFFFLGTFV